MDNAQEPREAAIDRVRKLWGSEPGRYWEELRKAKLETTEVFPELVIKDPVVIPDLDKDEQTKKGKK